MFEKSVEKSVISTPPWHIHKNFKEVTLGLYTLQASTGLIYFTTDVGLLFCIDCDIFTPSGQKNLGFIWKFVGEGKKMLCGDKNIGEN